MNIYLYIYIYLIYIIYIFKYHIYIYIYHIYISYIYIYHIYIIYISYIYISYIIYINITYIISEIYIYIYHIYKYIIYHIYIYIIYIYIIYISIYIVIVSHAATMSTLYNQAGPAAEVKASLCEGFAAQGAWRGWVGNRCQWAIGSLCDRVTNLVFWTWQSILHVESVVQRPFVQPFAGQNRTADYLKPWWDRCMRTPSILGTLDHSVPVPAWLHW